MVLFYQNQGFGVDYNCNCLQTSSMNDKGNPTIVFNTVIFSFYTNSSQGNKSLKVQFEVQSWCSVQWRAAGTSCLLWKNQDHVDVSPKTRFLCIVSLHETVYPCEERRAALGKQQSSLKIQVAVPPSTLWGEELGRGTEVTVRSRTWSNPSDDGSESVGREDRGPTRTLRQGPHLNTNRSRSAERAPLCNPASPGPLELSFHAMFSLKRSL